MFIGHYSAAFVAAAHPKAPRLGTLFVAAQLVDIGFFSFVLAGVEHMRIAPGFTAMNGMDLYDMPITHSLVGSLAWAAAFALVLKAWLKDWTAGLIGGAVVLSHWVLDVLVHGPDMSIAGGAPKFGLALWNHPLIEMPLELALIIGSIWIYVGATKPVKVSAALPVASALLFILQLYNWFGPQPVTLDASMPITALVAFAVCTSLAYWLGRSRSIAP
ncbi:MAG: hypothetical protein RLZZ366_240 [Pseudomonadota bacterium]|jgi:hypothetical protein